MHVSHETPQQTHARLLKVIARAQLVRYPLDYAFEELPAAIGVLNAGDALAMVRDDEVWSVLVPARPTDEDRFRIARFHFEPGLDNSGFVGWLASHLKQKLGTGVLVVCGHNQARGGIFDYWGFPPQVADQTFAEIDSLIAAGS